MPNTCTIPVLDVENAFSRCPETIASDIDAILSRFNGHEARLKLVAYQQTLGEFERSLAQGYIDKRLCADVKRATRAVRLRSNIG